MAPAEGGPRGATLMDAVTHLAPTVGIVAACDFLAVARASFYRQRPVLGPSASPAPEPATPAERSAPARSLSEAERAAVLLVLHEERSRCTLRLRPSRGHRLEPPGATSRVARSTDFWRLLDVKLTFQAEFARRAINLMEITRGVGVSRKESGAKIVGKHYAL